MAGRYPDRWVLMTTCGDFTLKVTARGLWVSNPYSRAEFISWEALQSARRVARREELNEPTEDEEGLALTKAV